MTTAVPPNQPGFANNPHRGIASLTFKGKTLRFRTNPNEIWWSYTLNTNVEQTYGGRVVQILSTRIEDLVIKVECGWGGWPELNRIVDFLRQMMLEQRKNGGVTAVFNYTTRKWKMKVYALSVPFQDAVNATTRELEIRFKVVEDLSGQMTQIALSNELQRLQDGINFKKSAYNDPKIAATRGNSVREGPAISPVDTIGQLPGLGEIVQPLNSFIPPGIPGIPTP